jgi:hypothetical protein
MIYLLLGGALLLGYFWFARGRLPAPRRREWRLLSAGMALAAFTAAAWMGVRGAWGTTIVLVVAGLWLAASARKTQRPPPPPRGDASMSDAEARRILGVRPDATSDEIQAAYARLMRAVHPDKGGTTGLAAQLNAARDRLLRG